MIYLFYEIAQKIKSRIILFLGCENQCLTEI